MNLPVLGERSVRAPERILGLAALALGTLVCSVSPALARAPEERTGDPVRGAALFEKRCTGCHALDQNKEGPRLGDVYGRKAGAVPGFPYSEALKSSSITWDTARLDRWLTDTETVIPNNDMDFRVPSGEERADLVAFLRATAQRKGGPGSTD